jgi:hypothetical protein
MNMQRTYTITKISVQESITDQLWNSIPPLMIDHYIWEDNGYQPEVQVRLCYTNEKLHVNFITYEKDPLIRYYSMNEPVYTDSCVEFFVQPSPHSDARYLNFELNAAGTLLLGLGENRDRVRLSDVDPKTFAIQPQVNCTNPENHRTYWEIQYSIPFGFIKRHFPKFQPDSSTMLKGNFYKCGNDTAQPHYGCWNLIEEKIPNYHLSSYFGDLILE